MERRRIEVVEYDPQWPADFDRLRRAVAAALGEVAVGIEHVGSTSVPGLAAKPVIDLDVVIGSRADLPRAVRRLATLGYEHRGDLGVPGREAFKRPDEDAPHCDRRETWPPHHLYVCARDSAELARHLAFRDFLRARPQQAAAYAELKRRLAARFPHDIDAYIDGKADFIHSALRQMGIAPAGPGAS